MAVDLVVKEKERLGEGDAVTDEVTPVGEVPTRVCTSKQGGDVGGSPGVLECVVTGKDF